VGGKFGLIFVNISELDDVDLPTLASDMERDPNSDCMRWYVPGRCGRTYSSRRGAG
jgi:hypothetical protein